MKKNLNLIIFGPPGAGKDTQVESLLKYLPLETIETGAIIRDLISKSRSKMAKEIKEIVERGDLVNDSMMESIIKERLEKVGKENGLVLDGFPRTVKQAESLAIIFSLVGRNIDKVIFLDVPDEILIQRLSQRKICKACGATAFPYEDKCSKCNGVLIKRIDDNLDSINVRLQNYHLKTKPIIDFYTKRGIILTVNGDQDPALVSKEMLEGLGVDLN
jgi:adenylate kinase